MACTYNYETGEMKFDFHLVAYGEIYADGTIILGKV